MGGRRGLNGGLNVRTSKTRQTNQDKTDRAWQLDKTEKNKTRQVR